MKTIALNRGTLELPGSWDELTYDQKVFAFARLKAMTEKKISPLLFRILMLQHLTGYKPSSGVFTMYLKQMVYWLQIPFVSIFYLFRFGTGLRYRAYLIVWKDCHRPQRKNRDAINHNLFILSEQLDFAFRIEDFKIIWNRCFHKNPFPYLEIAGRKFTGRKFIQDVAPFTNITAKEYCDCCELYSGYINSQDTAYKERCADKLISILYPAAENYNENLVSDHMELISSLSAEIKFGIMFWFAGIVEFYTTHPIYSILFKTDKNKEEREGKISIGMNETILLIKKKGYSSIVTDTVNDFFDAQIKILKDYFSELIASGMKIEDLAAKTGYSIDIINKLI
ncbi:MAG: hypothetical protein E6767_19335 [Dysgonomonas sp.]|nr:hypothetical protein [Dysgonomonas sp.]